jgi:hypothetical protein
MTRPATDRTFDDVSRYGSLKWLAAAMGLSIDQLRTRLPQMQTDGLPPPDPIVGHYIKADVDAWIERRRKFSKHATVGAQTNPAGATSHEIRRREIMGRV